MISLRPLKEKDAPLMLEWMHDVEIQKSFQKNMMNMKLQNAIDFCKTSEIPKVLQSGYNLHFAIVDEEDEYLGTISLKAIDMENRTAEYAISTRRKVHGKGIAKHSTILLLEKAFDEYELHKVYLNVLTDNEAAIHLYEKCGFKLEGEARECLFKDGKYTNLKWYGILKSEFNQIRLKLS